MIFWDSSALVALLVEEKYSPLAEATFNSDSEILVWWATRTECVSALAQGERLQAYDFPQLDKAFAALKNLAASWREILPGDQIREIAERLLRMHNLRAADAFQLAACLFARTENPLTFITFDQKLSEASRREGVDVIGVTP